MSDIERPDEEGPPKPDEPGPPSEDPPEAARGRGEDPPEAAGAPGEERPDRGLDTDETSRLGLTEEFSRIESEMEEESGGADQAGPEREVPETSRDETGEWAPAADGPDSTEREWPEDDADWAGDDGPTEAGPGAGEREDAAGEREDAAGPGAAPVPPAAAPPVPTDAEADPGADLEAEAPDRDDEAGAEQPAAADDAPAGSEAPTALGPAATEHRAAPAPPAPIAPRVAGVAEEELAARAPSLALRFLAGSVLIVASIATAVAVTGLLFLSDVAAKLQPIPGIQQQLSAVDPGAPQTILIIGSDRREGAPKEDQRSDTTMLLRVDPEKEVLSLFSLPRDLKVDIPGYGVGKLNEAYTVGGEKKTLKTVKRFTGLEVNHVVEINFQGFADAVDAIECVYIDVDRDYFNDNSTALTPEEEYAEIDINSGYQRLCGLKALQYVRYRHEDTDLVRAARQQDFLREARQKVEPRQLLGAVFGTGTGNELINIFTDYTRSDISSEDDVIGILKSFANMQNVPVNEVHFEGDIGGPEDPYVTSTDKQVEQAIDEFLNGTGSEGQRGGEDAAKKPDRRKKKSKGDKKDPTDEANVQDTEAVATPGDKFPILAQRLEADAEKNARRLKIPVFYPTEVVPGSAFSTGSRTYEYENEDNKREKAYKTVITLTQPSFLVEYYGVMGTTWDDPPILRNPSEIREIDGREYLLFFDGDRLRQVGWREQGNSYWLSNTLPQSIGEAEMLAMAASMREV